MIDKELFPYIANTREELNEFISKFTREEDDFLNNYFYIKSEDFKGIVYFSRFNKNYFESTCNIVKTGIPEDELKDYVNNTYEKEYFVPALEFEKKMVKDGIHYDIFCPKCIPFLRFPVTFVSVFNDVEVLNYFTNQELLINKLFK